MLVKKAYHEYYFLKKGYFCASKLRIMAKKIDNTEEKIHAVEEALSKSERFIEKNQKILTIVIGSAVVIVLGIFAFQKLYIAPREKAAQAAKKGLWREPGPQAPWEFRAAKQRQK